jgi:pectin methylesterase-like acyl-CoA thioesterase
MAKRWARAALAAFVTVPLLWMGCTSTSGGGAGGDASLTGVSFSAGALRPATFAADTLAYFLDLPYGTTTFTVAPTATDPAATITVAQDGGAPVTVASGAASPALTAPAVTSHSIVEVVVKSGGVSRMYGFFVTQLIGHDATLSALAVSQGALNPAFTSGTTAYALSLPAGTATITVTPTANDPTATITVAQDSGTPVAVASGTASAPLPVPVAGNVSSVKVKVTAQDTTTTRTYTIAVSQLASNDASLSLLADSTGPVPDFASTILSYDYPVPFQTGAFTVTATPTSPQATVKVNGVAVTNGSPSQAIALTVGSSTPITVAVTSQDASATRTYTLNVTEGPQAGLVTARTVPTDPSPLAAVDAGSTLPVNDPDPANVHSVVPVDSLLRIGFDSAPSLGTTGTIAIHRASDGSVVDTINLADPYQLYDGSKVALTASSKVNVIGGNAAQVRVVNYVPVIISGNTAVIFPHNYKLAYNTTYYVTIDAGVLTGKRNGIDFAGIADPATWTFTTKTSAPATHAVAPDNSADFATVQGAIDALPVANSTAVTITIAPGVYQELLFIRDKKNITFQGSGVGVETVIQYDNSDAFNPGVGGNFAPATPGVAPGQPPVLQASGTAQTGGGRAVLLTSSVTGLAFDGITLKNTHAQSSLATPTIPPGAPTIDSSKTSYTPGPQAETIYFNTSSGGTLIAKRSNFVSYQDTIQVKGFSWFYDSFVTGDVDFIWGAAYTALFERCELRSRGTSGYVVNAIVYLPGTGASPTPPTTVTQAYGGFVFLNSAFTREDSNVLAYLARSKGALAATTPNYTYYQYDAVALIGCSMDAHVAPAGWAQATRTSNVTGASVSPNPVIGWREFHSFTPGGQWVDVSQRMPNPNNSSSTGFGSIQLSGANVSRFFPDRGTVFGGATDSVYTTVGISSPPTNWTLTP